MDLGAYYSLNMIRPISAFIAFNIYSLFLISAFQENTVHLFDMRLVSELKSAGEMFDLRDWGWNDHYIWRLFSGVIVTAFVAFLSGAIVKDNGGRIAFIANIPSILVWIATIYIMGFINIDIDGKTGFLIISIIAIPLTSWVAYQFGNIGNKTQKTEFAEGTVLGIKSYHWMWLVFPLYLYSLGIIFVCARFLVLQFLTWQDMSMVAAIISILAIIPIVAWIAPLVMAYKILSGESLNDRSKFIKFLANTGILVSGLIVATVIQIICFWLLQKLMSWWY